MAGKNCISCGAPVTIPDLTNGALQAADGSRYCSSCVALMRKRVDSPAQASSPNPVILAPDKPKPQIVLPSAPRPQAPKSATGDLDPADFPLAEEKAELLDPADFQLAEEEVAEEEEQAPPPAPRPETVRTAAGEPRPATPKPSPAPAAARTSRRRPKPGSKRKKLRRKKKPSEREKPAAHRRPAARTAGKETSARVKPGRRRSAARELPEDSGTSRRASRRSGAAALPWYFALNRGQWIGIAAGGGVFLLFVVFFAIWASSGPRRRTVRNRPPLAYGSGGNELLNQGLRLEKAGRKQEAMEAYRRAVAACSEKAEAARKNGDEATASSADYVARQANMRLYAIMKHSTLRGH